MKRQWRFRTNVRIKVQNCCCRPIRQAQGNGLPGSNLKDAKVNTGKSLPKRANGSSNR